MAERQPGALGAGHHFGRYTVLEFFAAGGMAEVYRARDVTTGEVVALKVLAGDLADDRQFRDRFLKETRLVTRLAHPHILPVLGSGEDNGVLYIATPFVDPAPYVRPDLAALLAAEGPLPLGVTLATISQIADALESAHEQGLVHRDVTPGNILLDRSGRDAADACAYLTDFGITRRATSRSTRTGGFIGTLHYASPEQIRNEPLDRRTDVYGLASVAYEMLTGRAPHAGVEDPGALVFAILDAAPSPVVASRPELPPAIDEVLAAGMAKDRRRRLPTPGALAEALAAAQDGTWTAPAVVTDPCLLDDETADTESQPAPRERVPWVRSRRVLYTAAALALVVTSGGVALAWTPDGGSDVAASTTEQQEGGASSTGTTDDPEDDVPSGDGTASEDPQPQPSDLPPSSEAPGSDIAGGDASSEAPDDDGSGGAPGGSDAFLPWDEEDPPQDDAAAPPQEAAESLPAVPAQPAPEPAPQPPAPAPDPPRAAAPERPAQPSGAITSPGNGAEVESKVLLQGTAQVPDGHRLWTLVKAADGLYYTTSPAPVDVGSAGTWSTRVTLGRGPEDEGTTAELIAVVAPEGGQIQAGVDNRGAGHYSARFSAIPGDSFEVSRIRVVMTTWV